MIGTKPSALQHSQHHVSWNRAAARAGIVLRSWTKNNCNHFKCTLQRGFLKIKFMYIQRMMRVFNQKEKRKEWREVIFREHPVSLVPLKNNEGTIWGSFTKYCVLSSIHRTPLQTRGPLRRPHLPWLDVYFVRFHLRSKYDFLEISLNDQGYIFSTSAFFVQSIFLFNYWL